jgi:hypothetical protein
LQSWCSFVSFVQLSAQECWQNVGIIYKLILYSTNKVVKIHIYKYICVFLVAELLARSQYPEGPATGHLDTGFSWFPCVYNQMLRFFPSFPVATTCFSYSPPDLNFLVTYI